MIGMLYAWLLHHANRRPSLREDFYRLKARLLKRYATPDGEDVQHIVDECWNCEGEGDDWVDDPPYVQGCDRCGGTGIYDEKWIPLRRWRWGRYIFHSPGEATRTPPAARPWIEGLIEHKPPGRLAREAEPWLYLLAGEWRSLWRWLTVRYCSWGPLPMATLNAMLWNGRVAWLKAGSCFYMWHLRIAARRVKANLLPDLIDDDIPF